MESSQHLIDNTRIVIGTAPESEGCLLGPCRGMGTVRKMGAKSVAGSRSAQCVAFAIVAGVLEELVREARVRQRQVHMGRTGPFKH